MLNNTAAASGAKKPWPYSRAAIPSTTAVSWALLLAGMFVKWVLRTSEVGVQVAGPIHGAVFVVYVVLALTCWRVLRWDLRTTALALVASIPPFATVWFERWAARTGRLPLGAPVTTP